MNFMFHTMLDAVGNIVRVHYKSTKCDASFSQGSISTLFGWGEHVFHVCAKMFFVITAVQKLFKNSNKFFQSYDHKCTATLFMNHCVKCNGRSMMWCCHSLRVPVYGMCMSTSCKMLLQNSTQYTQRALQNKANLVNIFYAFLMHCNKGSVTSRCVNHLNK